ncbi:MAG TPA: TonB-dependent receptor plug domain-containing protein, partial [Sphingopyxis sp.]|nr:TonB-dependent receptor plug domain-containing protein [Sphingopyxis sp.]
MRSSSSVAALLLALVANQAAAQDAAPAEEGEAAGTNEIIVTAQKRSEGINSVPLSITAVSGDDLQAQGVTDVAGLAKVTPGFNAINSGFGTPVYFLRGIGFFDSSLAAKPTVTVYTDEVPIPYSVMTAGASFDLERVEVLKGPQGTLFGSNATGGAINYIAAKPTWSPEAGLALSYGRFNRFSAEGYASGPLSDTLAARISLRHEGGGDWQKSYTRDASLGQRAFTQGRVQLAFRPVDTVRLNLMVNAYQDHGDTQAPQFIAPFQQSAGFFDPRLPTYPVAPEDNRAADWGTSFPLKKDNWQVQAALRGEIDLSDDITLTSISAYTRFKEAYGQESDGTTLRLTDVFLEGDIKAFSQELRLAGSLMGKGSWIVGGNYEWGKTHELLTQRLNDQSSAHVFDRFGFPSIELVPQLGDTKYR